MATVDPLVWPHARRAADSLAASIAHPSVVKAIAAHWVSEKGWSGPELTVRNNPGNLAFTWARGLPVDCCVDAAAPNGANPIVTFPSMAAGVAAYAEGLAQFSRYDPAVARAKAGDGTGFVTAVCEAGYGTSLATVTSVLGLIGEPPALVRVLTDNVRLRAAATVTAKMVEPKSMPEGTRVTVLRSDPAGGAYADDTGKVWTEWLQVIDQRNGITGWCAAAWTAPA